MDLTHILTVNSRELNKLDVQKKYLLMYVINMEKIYERCCNNVQYLNVDEETLNIVCMKSF